jgi:hypothetical protein
MIDFEAYEAPNVGAVESQNVFVVICRTMHVLPVQVLPRRTTFSVIMARELFESARSADPPGLHVSQLFPGSLKILLINLFEVCKIHLIAKKQVSAVVGKA